MKKIRLIVSCVHWVQMTKYKNNKVLFFSKSAFLSIFMTVKFIITTKNKALILFKMLKVEKIQRI